MIVPFYNHVFSLIDEIESVKIGSADSVADGLSSSPTELQHFSLS